MLHLISRTGKRQLLSGTPLVVVVVCIVSLLAVFVFWLRFHHLGISSETHVWAEFGGYLGGVLGPALAVVNLLVLARTAFEFRQSDQRYQQDKLLFDLRREWTSLNHVRHEADAVIRAHPHLSCRELHDDPQIANDSSVWKVLGFFDTLEFAAARGIVNEIYVASLFGQVFVWWYVVGAKRNYPVEWDFERRLDSLYERISRLHPDKIGQWTDRAEADLKSYKAGTSPMRIIHP